MAKSKASTPPMEDSKYDRWAVDNACRTLMDAEEIKQDPKMMKLVKPMIDKKAKTITSLQDLKDHANSMDHGMMDEIRPPNKKAMGLKKKNTMTVVKMNHADAAEEDSEDM